MIIDIEYKLGVGGLATIATDNIQDQKEFEINEFDEDSYSTVGIELIGKNGENHIINDVYNRNGISDEDKSLIEKEVKNSIRAIFESDI
ncbi:hypothetical protein [Holzapfeliella sp. JNUCC 72]